VCNDSSPTSESRHERKCLGVTREGHSAVHGTACLHRRRCNPAEGVLRASLELITERRGLPAQLSCRVPEALQPAVREQVPDRAAQPPAGQVAGQITNTPRNTRVRPPRSCYSYCMISPIRGNHTGFRVQGSSDTFKPHNWLFSGVRERRPGPALSCGGRLVGSIPPSWAVVPTVLAVRAYGDCCDAAVASADGAGVRVVGQGDACGPELVDQSLRPIR
jgi:hypothetical protein